MEMRSISSLRPSKPALASSTIVPSFISDEGIMFLNELSRSSLAAAYLACELSVGYEVVSAMPMPSLVCVGLNSGSVSPLMTGYFCLRSPRPNELNKSLWSSSIISFNWFL